jgi:hypothetical protein
VAGGTAKTVVKTSTAKKTGVKRAVKRRRTKA